MPRNGNEIGVLDNTVRRIIREELRNIFSSRDAQEGGVDQGTERRSRGGTIGGRVRGANKGQVKNPMDKRLKQNRGA